MYGSRIVFLADEFYLKAGADIPDHDEYEDYPQVENGVGMLSLFKYEFVNALKICGQSGQIRDLNKEVSVATGLLAKNFIDGLVQGLSKHIPGLCVNVYGVENAFFGKHVNVSGLVTGRDLVNALRGNRLGDELFIPGNMLKSDELLFLDDYSLDELQEEIGVTVTPVEVSGNAFLESITGGRLSGRYGGE